MIRAAANIAQPPAGLSGIGIEIGFEHHARERWPWFADRAAELGVSFVRFGEFVWDIIERGEGDIDFSILDEFVRLLAERGINTVLATPTASPPDWLCTKDPEIVPANLDGISYGTATRRHCCPTSPRFREHGERMVRAMARHYAGNQRVIGWQIDNEIGHPTCYCRLCHRAFQLWLQRRFRDIDTFNFSAGQSLFGRTSRRFDEVPLAAAGSNPCLHHLYHLFMDHQVRECYGLQYAWLREEGVRGPITHNAMLTWWGYDHERFFEKLDVVSGDAYPTGLLYRDDDLPGIAFYSAYLRGIKHGLNFGMAETRCGPVVEGGAYPAPGQIKQWAYCFLAGGANFVHFFRLDTCPSGLERGVYGLIPASGAIPSAYPELQQLCAEVKTLLPSLLETSAPIAPVGILYSHPTHLSLQHRAGASEEFAGPAGNGYTLHLARHFCSLASQNIPADIVQTDDDFRKYRVLIVTALTVLDASLAAKIIDYVESGGVLIVGPQSGLQDENAKLWEIPIPANLVGAIGAKVIVSEVLDPDGHPRYFIPRPRTGLPRLKVSTVADQLHLEPGAELLAVFNGHPARQRLPALSRHRFGTGTAYVLAAFFDADSLAKLYRALLAKHGIGPQFSVPRGIHYLKRVGEKGDLYFFFNSSRKRLTFVPPTRCRDALTRKTVRRVEVAPGKCKIVLHHELPLRSQNRQSRRSSCLRAL